MAETRRLLLRDIEATRAFARRLAGLLRQGDLIALEGELGVGKTEFVRAVVGTLAGRDIEVPSPTFTLIQRYELPAITLTHADLYRIHAPDELAELGLEDALAEGCLFVEWPERAGAWLPLDRLTLRLFFAPEIGDSARWLEVEAGPSWQERIGRLAGSGNDAQGLAAAGDL